jgi:hypothetical protein
VRKDSSRDRRGVSATGGALGENRVRYSARDFKGGGMAEEILRADQRLRRTTAIALVLALIAALVLVFVFQAWMSRWISTMPTPAVVIELRRGAAFALVASGLCLLLLGGYAARIATRIQQKRRWPLDGARVLRDTVVRRGEAALGLGRLLNVAAITLVLMAAGVGLVSWQLFRAAH